MAKSASLSRVELPQGVTVSGHAIVCADGMIAHANGNIPDALIVEQDQKKFQQALDKSALVVLGRKGHEKHPSKGRQRLVVTTSVAGLIADSTNDHVHFWNPADIDFVSVLSKLAVSEGNIAITGGQSVFALFLPYYTSFVLAEVHDVRVQGGIACFAQGHPREVLAAIGMQRDRSIELAPNVTQTVWSPKQSLTRALKSDLNRS